MLYMTFSQTSLTNSGACKYLKQCHIGIIFRDVAKEKVYQRELYWARLKKALSAIYIGTVNSGKGGGGYGTGLALGLGGFGHLLFEKLII